MKTPTNFTEFWDFYVSEHGDYRTRQMHFLGTTLGVILMVWFVSRGTWYYLPLALVPSYAMAWISHFFIEHNTPATFKYPLWSLAGDWKMVWFMLQGKMSAEVERVRNQNPEIF